MTNKIKKYDSIRLYYGEDSDLIKELIVSFINAKKEDILDLEKQRELIKRLPHDRYLDYPLRGVPIFGIRKPSAIFAICQEYRTAGRDSYHQMFPNQTDGIIFTPNLSEIVAYCYLPLYPLGLDCDSEDMLDKMKLMCEYDSLEEKCDALEKKADEFSKYMREPKFDVPWQAESYRQGVLYAHVAATYLDVEKILNNRIQAEQDRWKRKEKIEKNEKLKMAQRESNSGQFISSLKRKQKMKE